MAIVIRNAKMPNSCVECPCFKSSDNGLANGSRCIAYDIIFGRKDAWIFDQRPAWCPLEEVPEETNIDRAIASVAYILDSLMSYRDIVRTGDCNDCGAKNTCGYVPRTGQMVRYNCPHYEK